MTTKIEWTDETWNPVTGCTKVSQGCKHCYAETIANRFWGERKFTDVRCHPERLEIPLHWKNPRMVFVNSMSDLFHRNIPRTFIDLVFRVMYRTPQHTYQILTKRPELMNAYFSAWKPEPIIPLPNVWLGVSVENQATADERIPWLLKTPAAVRFISYEPALEKVDFQQSCFTPENPFIKYPDVPSMKGINWVICGCESGPKSRPMDIDWARFARNQCLAEDISFFLKQMVVDGKLTKMPELDGRTLAEYPA